MSTYTPNRSNQARMPEISGISHVSLSVRDREESVRWYGEIFGFQLYERSDTGQWSEAICYHPSGPTVIAFQQHGDGVHSPFDPRTTGLDHLAFAVETHAELQDWQARLADLGVRHSAIAHTPLGSVLCLRDPDNIQIELFALSPDLPTPP